MADRYIIAADYAHLRIYRYSQEPGQFTPTLQPVDAFDFPESPRSYPGHEPDVSGGLYAENGRNLAAEERIPFQEDVQRRSSDKLAARISSFMLSNPNSTWDLAADSSLRDDLIDHLPDAVRRRLNQVISRDLVNAPPAELREHFALR